jgi:hypothetical protein
MMRSNAILYTPQGYKPVSNNKKGRNSMAFFKKAPKPMPVSMKLMPVSNVVKFK